MQIRPRRFVPVVTALLALAALPGAMRAQEAHVVDEADLRRAVARDAARADAHREAIREVLARPDVEAVAERMGLDLQRARSAIPTLTDDEAARLAERARQVEEDLAAGQESFTISTTWIIIGLLILITLILIL